RAVRWYRKATEGAERRGLIAQGLMSALGLTLEGIDRYSRAWRADEAARKRGVWFGLGQPSLSTRERLAKQPPQVRFGEYLSSQYLPEGVVPIRLWARQHGLERALRWDPRTGSVYIGWQKIPYSFIVAGRSYADEARLDAILRRLRAAGAVR
ncbi:MAG: hypothetical protein ACPLTR_10555, partial [Thermacetogeniaceae bacterium]